MSTEYDLYCRTCEKAAGFWDVVNRASLLEELWADRVALAAAAPAERWLGSHVVDAACTFPPGFLAWCAEHKDHDVAIRDEYGRFRDKCNQPIRCAHCGHRGRCDLDRGHAGECKE